MTSRTKAKAVDFLQTQMTAAGALFGAAGVVIAAAGLNAAVSAPAEAKPRPYASYAPKSYAAPAQALGDRVARAAQSHTYAAYQGAAADAYAAQPAYAPTAPAAGNGLKPTMVFFSAPIRGFSINSTFGLRRLASEKHARRHEGVDFAAPSGSPVLCAAEGRVVRTGNSSTYGRFVEVEHPNGVTSFYAHLSQIGVSAGAPLSAGTMLGKVGSTGRSTGPHLHFEIRRNGQQVDPSGFLGRQFAANGGGQFQTYKIIHGMSAGGGAASGKLRGVVTAE